MADDYRPEPDPKHDAFIGKLHEQINEQEIIRALGLNLKQATFFKHAVYYVNGLLAGVLVPEDLQQIELALYRIGNEIIPNVPIIDNNGGEIPLQLLRDQAVYLLVKATIKGLTINEIAMLEKVLRLLLKPEDLSIAEAIVKAIKDDHEGKIVFPVPHDLLEKYLEHNKRILAA